MSEFGHTAQPAGVRCPFYGFVWPAATSRLQHVAGNRCGLALDRVEACAMEAAGLEVDVRMCPAAQRLEHFIHSAGPVMAFVTPDYPEGLPYSEWWRCTMRPSSEGAPPARVQAGTPTLQTDSVFGEHLLNVLP
jgi:hypothetical protein